MALLNSSISTTSRDFQANASVMSGLVKDLAKKRAIVALGHSILVSAYYMLKAEVDYHDLGSDHLDRRRHARTTKHLVSRLEGLGYEVKLEPKQAA